MAGIATGVVVEFTIAADPAQTGELFTHIEVYRSRSGPEGPYEEITGPAWAPATLSTLAKNAVISGKQLKLRVQEKTDLTITFSGADPLLPADIATQIEAQGLGLLDSYVSDGNLVIATMQPGAASTLRILESDVAPLLGFSHEEPDAVGFGKDARMPLTPEQSAYAFTDPHGASTYNYRVRFSNFGINQVSEYSAPFTAQDKSSISADLMVTGYVDLITLEGKPYENIEVSVHTQSASTLLGDTYLVAEQQIRKVTDAFGHAEFSLPRGQTFTMVVTGTSIARDITTPTDPTITSFNMLDPAYGTDDAFKVQRPEVAYAVRRAL